MLSMWSRRLARAPIKLPAQIQRERKFRITLFGGHGHQTRRVACAAESSQTAALRLIGVDRKLFVRPPAGMRHVIRAAPDCTPRPCVHDIKHQWRMNRDDWGAGRRAAATRGSARPPQIRPVAPVGCSGTRRPLHSTMKRGSIMPETFTCIRSTEESTLRAVPPADVSSPSTFQGSSACRAAPDGSRAS